MMQGSGKIHMVTFILLVIGGLNWLAYGLFQWEVGSILGGMDTMLSRIIYVLVGLSAVYELATHKKMCKECEKMSKPMSAGTGMPPSSMPR